MHHQGKISFGKLPNRPFHAECSCGTGGDFADHSEARNHLAMHLTRLQGINSAEFVDETVAPLPIPAPEAEQMPEVSVMAPEAEEEAKQESTKTEKRKKKDDSAKD